MNSTVYIIQNSGRLDFSKAERFGTLVVMLKRDAFPDDHEERIITMRRILTHYLKNYNPARDFLLLTGDPIAIGLAVLVLSERTLDIHCLKYDRENHDYYAVKL